MPTLLNKLERIFGRFAIPNLSLYLVAGQIAVFVFGWFDKISLGRFVLYPALVPSQPWRLLTFLLVPPLMSPLFIAFAWWLFYIMGTALEDYWGVFRYNLFLFVGWLLTVAAAFLTPQLVAVDADAFLAGSVFLAFAYLNPDFELALFLILPVKIKWLALLTWAFYAVSFIRGDWGVRCQVLAATGNFFLFFGRDLFLTARLHRRRMTGEAKRFAQSRDEPAARHRCRICGKTELTHPQLDFRYCSKCAGEQCYCSEHIFNHEHVLSDEKAEV